MPEIKNTFLGGKMNKDLDDRLLPEGEYRDAQNIEVLKPDGSNVGVIQNAAGNTIAHTTLGLSSDVDVIGTYFDEKNKRIYWFVTDNNDLSATDWYINAGLTDPRFHAIYYYDANPASATFKTAKAIVTGRFLKFSKKYKITGVAMIDDLLFWTDNKNQPRKINVTKAIGDTSFYNNELKIGRGDNQITLVNNAGITRDNLLMRMKENEWDDIIDTNLSSIFRLSKAVLRPMMKKKNGRIINIGSVVGTMGNAGQANYAAAKAGVIGFSKSLAREVASRGITVNVVAPGFIQTDMTDDLTDEQKAATLANVPAGRLGQPDEIAAAVCYLASDAAAYVSGETLHVNGAMYMV